ncbi:MAG: DUF4012 domain-containing protein [bacterium]
MNNQTQTNRPTTLIVFGGNMLGEKLTELLSTQKSNIILVDEFNRETKSQIKQIKKNYDVKTYDLSGLESLTSELKRIDYVFILLGQYLEVRPEISSKQFLSITNSVDTILKLAHKHGAKTLLATTINLHRKLANLESFRIENLSDSLKGKSYASVELQRYCETLAAEYHDQASLDIRIARIGEVIGKGVSLDKHSVFTDLIKESVTRPRITIKGEGLDSAYYIHILDVVYGIIKTVFSNKTNGEVFSLSYPEEITTLSLAYKILELNPKAQEIAFTESEDDTPQQIYVPAKNLSKIGWKPKVKFDKAILETLEYVHEQYKIAWKDKPDQDFFSEKIEPRKRKKRDTPTHISEQVTPVGRFFQTIALPFVSVSSFIEKSLKKIRKVRITPFGIAKTSVKVAIFVSLYLFLIAPLLQIIVGGGLTYLFAKRGYQQSYNLESQKAETSFERAKYFSSVFNQGWQGFRWIRYIPSVENFYDNTSLVFGSINHLSEGAYYLSQGLSPYIDYFKAFEPIATFDGSSAGGSRTYLNELKRIEKSSSSIDRATVEITQATNSLNDINLDIYPSFISEYIGQLQEIGNSAKDVLNTLNDFAKFIPDLLGKDERQNYIILFQNPMELRSTGGWLTSFAIVGIEHGQIRTLDVQDVYNVDGQIETSVEPPTDMKSQLEIDDWTLSLSNWNPDFPQAAEAAEYFLTLTDQVYSVDGVISVDLEFVRNLVDVWGQVTVPGESEPVTKDNLYYKVIEIHRAFTPGSDRKEVFLSNLANEIMKNIFQSSKNDWPKISQVITDGLENKHVLAYIYNSEVDQNINDLGWSGRIGNKENTVFPVEWNYGANKANYFLERASTMDINVVDENTVMQTLEITYRNNSDEDKYPEGPYENYVRVYLPYGASVTDVTGLEKSRKYTDNSVGKDVVAGFISVGLEDEESFRIKYTLTRDAVRDFPITINRDEVEYKINYLKQPGLMDDPITLEISHPNSWTPVDSNNIQRQINSLVIQTELDTDKEFTVKWLVR